MRAPGSGAIAVAHSSIKSTNPPWKRPRLVNVRIENSRSRSIHRSPSVLKGAGSNCDPTFTQAGIGRVQLNIACSMLSKLQLMRLSILILCAAISISFAAQPEVVPAPTVPAAAAEAGKDVVHQLNNAFAKVFEIVAPSVVIIEISKKNDGSESSPFDDLFFQGPPDENNQRRDPNGSRPIQSEGSGFIVRPDGYIFTNFHVVEGADKIEVKLRDGRDFPARVVGSDEKTDIAVIKIDAKDLPIVQLGNSGGPLCDIDGKVIGMNTLINGMNRGLGFAIPVNMAKEIGAELIAGHKIVRPWLGIRIETLGDDPSIRDLFKGADKGVD